MLRISLTSTEHIKVILSFFEDYAILKRYFFVEMRFIVEVFSLSRPVELQ